MTKYKLKVLVILLATILLSLVLPVFAVDYSPGVVSGKYVKLGWYSVNVPQENLLNWEKIQILSVTGEEVDWSMTGEMLNGSAMPNSGEHFFTNVQTGTTNYTHSVLGVIIAGNLKAGDPVALGTASIVVNSTELRTYLNVSRSVNVLVLKSSGTGQNGPWNSTVTYVYDKASGMLLENENREAWPNGTRTEAIVDLRVSETNLFSAQTAQGLPLWIWALSFAAAATPILVVFFALLKKQRLTVARPHIRKLSSDNAQKFSVGKVNSGVCYLSNSLERCFKVVSDLRGQGIGGMAIVRENPALVEKSCNLKPDHVILLSAKPIAGYHAVNSLQEVSIAITKFIKEGVGVILLDGLVYLISRFGFNPVYMMLQEKKIEFLESGAVFLVPVNLETIDAREKGQLLCELQILEH